LFGAHKPARYDAKRAAVFAENLVEHVLLPYEHRHVTFTVRKRVRPYFKFDRTLNSILYDAAWESWKERILEQCPNGTAAAVEALHSFIHKHLDSLWIPSVASILTIYLRGRSTLFAQQKG
jgi:hypothetical protein